MKCENISNNIENKSKTLQQNIKNKCNMYEDISNDLSVPVSNPVLKSENESDSYIESFNSHEIIYSSSRNETNIKSTLTH